MSAVCPQAGWTIGGYCVQHSCEASMILPLSSLAMRDAWGVSGGGHSLGGT